MILVDDNLSYRIASVLKDSFNGIIHVSNAGLDGVDDSLIWEYATNNKLHILTKDRDFNDIQQVKGFPPKIIWLRIGNSSTKEIVKILKAQKTGILSFFESKTNGVLELQN